MKYLGGEIEISPDQLLSGEISGRHVFKDLLFLSNGRTALKKIVTSLNCQYPLLIPDYFCSSILQPIKELNLEYDFYRLNQTLEPDTQHIGELMNTRRYCAILVVDYFGWIQDRIKIRGIIPDYENFCIIQDASHSTFIPYLLTDCQYYGDHVFGSLRKIFPVPDGGFVLNPTGAPESEAGSCSESTLYKALGKTLRGLYLLSESHDSEMETHYMSLLQKAESILDKGEIIFQGMSSLSQHILSSLEFNSIFKKRRENYLKLYDLLINDPVLADLGTPLLKVPGQYDMPYMFPFIFKGISRDFVQEELKKKGIFSSIIWNEGNMDEVKNESVAKYISRNVLCFPVDQRYSPNDMEHIHKEINKIISRS